MAKNLRHPPAEHSLVRDSGKPGRDCPLCPRLVSFRQECRESHPLWHNAPVASFGPVDARLLIVGLAPGLQGANRTGRPFTGDFAGTLLYATLLKFGFAEGTFEERADDTLRLVDARISNAVRCVPPENKPLPAEIATCRQFLNRTIAEMKNLRAILALGRVAHDSVVTTLGAKKAQAPFSHGAKALLGPIALFDSYHCSRYNTNTGVLTTQMFHAAFAGVRDYLNSEDGTLKTSRRK
jgi:uracil-DNA glycosylase family 4